MAMTEAQVGIYQEVKTNPVDRWPKSIEGFLTVIMDGKNPLFEEMARVIESPDCRRILGQYIVSGSDGKSFCPISRKASQAREWVTKMRKKRNGDGS